MAQSIERIEVHPQFKKHFKKRIAPHPALAKKFTQRLRLFKQNRSNALLRDHSLTGNLEGYRSFRITGDIRIVYRLRLSTTVEFFDIGSHNQVYQ